jgi:uncharacterized protein
MTLEHDILRRSRTIAVVGLSPKEDRASHRVAAYLKEQGYTIIPVNPIAETILGEKSYPDLEAIPVGTVDTVDIFRRAEDAPPIVQQAIKLGAGAVWMQEGIASEDAALLAREAGLDVVMDRCMLKEHRTMTEG